MNDSFDQGDFAAAPVSSSATTRAPEAFIFTGSGSEYFRIWIVNLFFKIITVGIYSAWAKVRRLRYFYGNTSVAGTSFDYHGNPIAILKGRVIGLTLVAAFHLLFGLTPLVTALVLVSLGAVAPWLIWRSLQFKLHNSSYRGIRFGLRGSSRDAYKAFLLWPLLASVTGLLLAPMAHQRIKRFQHSEARFGSSHFSFHAGVGSFYRAYLLGASIWALGLLLLLAGFSGSLMLLLSGQTAALISLAIMAALLYAWTFLTLPLFFTLLQNLVWNHTRLGQHTFSSRMHWGRVLFIALTNLIGVACTMGLYTPFAQLRMARYRIESMQLLPAGALDEFIAASEPDGSATGEGVADLVNFDLSL